MQFWWSLGGAEKNFHRAREMALDSVVFPRNTLLFEREGKGARVTHWDTYAFLVCGHHPKCEKVHICQVEGVDSGHPEAESSHEIWEGDIEISPPPLYSIDHLIDPFPENPKGKKPF